MVSSAVEPDLDTRAGCAIARPERAGPEQLDQLETVVGVTPFPTRTLVREQRRLLAVPLLGNDDREAMRSCVRRIRIILEVLCEAPRVFSADHEDANPCLRLT